MSKTAVIVTADQHIGSTTGLCTPLAERDKGTYRATPGQRWLWNSWLDFWANVKDITKGYRVVSVFAGDTVELDSKLRSDQMWSRNSAIIKQCAANVLEPATDISDAIYFIRGTEAHTGKSASGEEALAKDFDNTVKDGKSYSWWHLRQKASGVRFDIGHHITGGRLPWTEANAANKLAAIIRSRYAEMEQPCPHVASRSHIHRRSDSGKNFLPLFARITGAWQLNTAYAYRIGAENATANITGDIYLCEHGEYQWIPFEYKPIRRRLWLKTM